MKAPIKSVVKCGDVTICILVEAEGVVGATVAGFQIANDGINPLELWLIIRMAAASNHWIMYTTYPGH
jgi:hypothetical protein